MTVQSAAAANPATRTPFAEAVHRIRELLRMCSKAEIAAWIARENERICELEAELAECRSTLEEGTDYLRVIMQDRDIKNGLLQQAEADREAWKARAEEAEARVAELVKDRDWCEAILTEELGSSGWHYPRGRGEEAREKEKC